MTPQVTTLVESIRARMETRMRDLGFLHEGDDGAEPGELGAQNPDDVLNAFVAYVGGIADALLAEYEMSDDEAIDFVFGVAADMAAEGLLAPLPEGDDPDSLSLWMGQASTAGLAVVVMKAAEDSAE
jgi:hypothetical protein